MSSVSTTIKEFQEMNCLIVEVGTNCPKGGDSGHGGITILRFRDNGSTDLRVAIDGDETRAAREVKLVLGGDSECSTLISALEFALRTLKTQQRVNAQSR